jgi:hypothetical protein
LLSLGLGGYIFKYQYKHLFTIILIEQSIRFHPIFRFNDFIIWRVKMNKQSIIFYILKRELILYIKFIVTIIILS